MKHRLTEAVSNAEHKRGLRVAQGTLQKEMAVFDGKGFKYADLAIYLAFLRATAIIHQSHHWQTLGSSFYADHLLFQRLYEANEVEVDSLAEKVVGLDSPALTNYFLQIKHMKAFMDAVSNSEKPPMVISLQAEIVLIAAGEMIQKRLEEEGLLTVGVANLLGDILDRHEGHVYLLQQRLMLTEAVEPSQRTVLYHISGWEELSSLTPGSRFILKPGSQSVEGKGVYFSADKPVPISTAEGSKGIPAAVVKIYVSNSRGWWRTKPGLAKKFGRQITWHSDGKEVACTVKDVNHTMIAGKEIPVLSCDWSFA